MIKELLPSSIANDGKIRALAESLEGEFENIKEQIEKVLIIPKIEEIDNEEILDLLAWQFHIEGYELAQNMQEKRNLIKNAIDLHRHKGTPYAIKKVLEALSLQGQIKEWFEYGGLSYHFKIELGIENREITTRLRDQLIKLIEEYKNERSWLEEIILAYLSRAQVHTFVGGIGEATSTAHMIDGFTWTSTGDAYISVGSMGEAQAVAVMEAA